MPLIFLHLLSFSLRHVLLQPRTAPPVGQTFLSVSFCQRHFDFRCGRSCSGRDEMQSHNRSVPHRNGGKFRRSKPTFSLCPLFRGKLSSEWSAERNEKPDTKQILHFHLQYLVPLLRGVAPSRRMRLGDGVCLFPSPVGRGIKGEGVYRCVRVWHLCPTSHWSRVKREMVGSYLYSPLALSRERGKGRGPQIPALTKHSITLN